MDVGLAAPDSLKSTCMSLLEVWVKLSVPALALGEPASAWYILGDAQRSPGISNSVPEYKWEGTADLSAGGKDLTGVRQTKQPTSISLQGF